MDFGWSYTMSILSNWVDNTLTCLSNETLVKVIEESNFSGLSYKEGLEFRDPHSDSCRHISPPGGSNESSLQ